MTCLRPMAGPTVLSEDAVLTLWSAIGAALVKFYAVTTPLLPTAFALKHVEWCVFSWWRVMMSAMGCALRDAFKGANRCDVWKIVGARSQGPWARERLLGRSPDGVRPWWTHVVRVLRTHEVAKGASAVGAKRAVC